MNNKDKNINTEFFLSQWISGELTDSELRKLVSEEDFLAYKKLKKGINVFTELEKPLDNSFYQIQNKLENKPKIRLLNLKWIVSIAAMLLFFIGFYQFLGNDGVLTSTNFGEQKTVALLDGSEVILNAKSAINYSKKDWKKNREIFLNGEAFFKVKKGKTFTVKTKNGMVTVLGTQFTVKSVNDYFEVVCYQGKVKVTLGNKTQILNPSQAFRKIGKDKVEQFIFNKKLPTWLSGESNYKSVPLKYVITDFENQFHIKIDDSNINNSVIFTGSFNHNDINIALKTIFDALSINYKKTNKQIVLYK